MVMKQCEKLLKCLLQKEAQARGETDPLSSDKLMLDLATEKEVSAGEMKYIRKKSQL